MRRWRILRLILVLVLILVALLPHLSTARILRSYGYTRLHWAAIDGDAVRIQRLLASGGNASPDTSEGRGIFGPPRGETPLHLAAERGHAEAVRILLDNGANANAADEKHQTPLHRAAGKHRFEVALMLMKKGADIDAADEYGSTPLLLAAQDPIDPKLTELLLTHGARVLPTKGGTIALHYVSCHGSAHLIEMMLARGADVNARDSGGETPLHFAANAANPVAVKLLLDHGARVNATDLCGKTPLHGLSWRIHDPSEADVRTVAEMLLAHGASVVARDEHGMTPLDACARHGDRKLTALLRRHGATSMNIHTLIGEGRLSEVEALLRTDPKQVELPEPQISNPPLYTAIELGDLAAVRMLVEHGAKINARQGYNKGTALHEAARHASLDIAKYLISKGAKVSALDNQGCTPLHKAVDEGNVAMVRLLLNRGASVSTETNSGWTPLHYAANNGDAKMVQFLLNHWANATPEDEMGRTPLFLVMSEDPVGDKLSTARILITYVPSVFARDKNGQTPLFEAAKNGHTDLVKLLLGHGARIHIKDKDGKRPAQYASNAETVRALSRLWSW